MRIFLALFLPALLFLSACGPASPTPVPASLTVEYSFATASWLADLYTCAGTTDLVAEQRAADAFDPQADLTLRLGVPAGLNTPAYQVGNEDLLVVVNKVTPVVSLTVEQAAGLFSGRITDWSGIDPGKTGKVQPWVFASGEDVEQLFEQAVLGGSPVSSQARLASTPDEMSRAVAADPNAIGLLPRHWKAGNVTAVLTAAAFPILALTPAQPAAGVAALVTCLQSK
jgi:hypothetical protein